MAGLGKVLSGLSQLLCRNSTIAAITVRNESSNAAAAATTTAATTTPAADKPKSEIVYAGMDPNKWAGHLMYRDVKRRRCAKEHATMRVRLISMKRNNILPLEIRELAGNDLNEIPRQAALRQLTPRCVITSRAYGNVQRWRFSRIIFRDLADYNKLAGVQRAMW